MKQGAHSSQFSPLESVESVLITASQQLHLITQRRKHFALKFMGLVLLTAGLTTIVLQAPQLLGMSKQPEHAHVGVTLGVGLALALKGGWLVATKRFSWALFLLALGAGTLAGWLVK